MVIVVVVVVILVIMATVIVMAGRKDFQSGRPAGVQYRSPIGLVEDFLQEGPPRRYGFVVLLKLKNQIVPRLSNLSKP